MLVAGWQEIRRDAIVLSVHYLVPTVPTRPPCRPVRHVAGVAIALLAWGLPVAAQVPPVITAVEPDPVVGSNDGQWVVLRGRGFSDPFNVRLVTDDVGASVSDPRNLRYVDSSEVALFTVVGNEAAEWAVSVAVAGRVSEPASFRVVPPRPVIETAALTGRVGGPVSLVVLGPGLTRYTSVLWDGELVDAVPIQTSANASALTLGFRAALPPSVARDVPHEVLLTTAGPGGGTSDPYVLTVPPVPLTQQPAVWAAAAVALVVVGLGLLRRRADMLHARELEARVAERTAALNAALAVQAAQADRLRALDRQRRWFLAGAMHEVRTPLALVVGALDGVGPVDARAARLARENVERLVDRLDELSELAEIGGEGRPLHKVTTDLVALAHEAVAEAATPAYEKGVDLGFTGSGTPTWADVDARAVRRALGNLVANAVRHTPPGGGVRVSVEQSERGDVALIVEDDGPGVAPEDRERVFERFVQAGSPDAAVGRSGIGLALARELAELHGGTVRLDPDPPTRFVIDLPGALVPPPPRAADSAPPDPAPPGDEGEAPLVLVADDNDDVRALLRSQLEPTFRVAEAVNGSDALAAVRRLKPDLVVLDVMMPGRGGLDVLGDLRADPAVGDVPVVVLTARTDVGARAFGVRADAFVRKPWARADLVARAVALVETRRDLKRRYGDDVVLVGDVPIEGDDAVFVRGLRAAVGDNLHRADFGVAELALAVSKSRNTLWKHTRRVLGVTPTEALREARLDRASDFLRAGVRRVSDVAERVGYANHDLFTSHFRERFGMPPSAYRDLFGGEPPG